MKTIDIRNKAIESGLKVRKNMSKKDLVKAIQRAEGNFDCFGSADGYCDQINCMWRGDCLKT